MPNGDAEDARRWPLPHERDGLGTTEPTSVRPPRVRGGEPGVQLACRKVLAALDGLDAGAQLRVLRAAALLLGPDTPADA